MNTSEFGVSGVGSVADEVTRSVTSLHSVKNASVVGLSGGDSLEGIVTPEHVRSNSSYTLGRRRRVKKRLPCLELEEVQDVCRDGGGRVTVPSLVEDIHYGVNVDLFVDRIALREDVAPSTLGVGSVTQACESSTVTSLRVIMEGVSSPMRDSVINEGIESRSTMLATPEEVRNNLSYLTPEVESKSSKKRRKMRRYYAKKRALGRLSLDHSRGRLFEEGRSSQTRVCQDLGQMDLDAHERSPITPLQADLCVDVMVDPTSNVEIMERVSSPMRDSVINEGLESHSTVLATPEEVRNNLSYLTPEVESKSAKKRRKVRRYYAKKRALGRLSSDHSRGRLFQVGRSSRTPICQDLGRMDVDVHESSPVTTLRDDSCVDVMVDPTINVEIMEGVSSPLRDATISDGLHSRLIVLATPEEVRNNPSYLTPEVESKSAKKRRKIRRYYAKKRALGRLSSNYSRGRLFQVCRSSQTPVCQDLGRMEFKCSLCSALRWKVEKNSSFCCMKGKLSLPLMPSPPLCLLDLYTSSDDVGSHFRKHVRSYNNSLAFASLGVNLDRSVANSVGGAYTFRVSGRLYHHIGGLLPLERPSFSQIYIMDGDDLQLKHRCLMNAELRRDVLSILQSMMMELNPFAQRFKNIALIMRENVTKDIRLRIVSGCSQSRLNRQFNAPTSNEIAVLMPIEDIPSDGKRDIILHSIQDGLQHITEHHSSYDALHFVLLFPYGTDGWHQGIPHVHMRDVPLSHDDGANDSVQFDAPDEHLEGRHKVVTIREFYSYHLQVRAEHVSPIHLGGRLLQEYVCDVVAKMVQNNMNYFYNNRDRFRREIRSGIVDALGAHSASDIGQRIVLPSSYIGSPRHLHQQYQDAMAVVRELGSPDLFITMTANPNWLEVKRELRYQQTPADRPDLVSRVFSMKLQHLIDLLKKDGIFGRIIGRLHVVEFQKRGLPHAHLLVILEERSKPITVGDYDRIVCAEIPMKEVDPELYEIVRTCMMHGPCGTSFPNAPCMKDGKCSKKYPRSFVEETVVEKGYLSYRRRDNGMKVRSRGVELDNRWVVPYNKWLTLHFQCHINVEVCVHMRSVKYLYKYVYKGPDMITTEAVEGGGQTAGPVNEIEQFLNARYFSASEACWRLFGLSMGAHKPGVTRLTVHLPGQELVYFSEGVDLEEVVDSRSSTTLTTFFELNRSGDLEARELLYQDLPRFYVYNKGVQKWTRRINAQSIPTIGRMYFVHPSEGERFYLRVLLAHVRGATSFEDLRTVDGELFFSFRDACKHRLLINDAMEWSTCLLEAVSWGTPSQLRLIFAVLLLTCAPFDPLDLWRSIERHLVEDYAEELGQPISCETVHVSQIMIDKALLDVETHMQASGKSLKNFGFTLPDNNVEFSPLFREEIFLDETISDVEAEIKRLNGDQRIIYDRVIHEHVTRRIGGVFFVDGPGGTGKTFLYSVMLSYVRAQGWIALAVASSGIAALLMKGGRTAHSRFKIPPTELNESSTCNISKQSPLGTLLMACRLIIWDEAPMVHKYAIECVDRSLRDILSIDTPFGGVPIVFGGDFRQVLPVVRRGSRAQIVSASLKCSHLWRYMEVHKLSTNMRVMSVEGADRNKQSRFAEYLLSIGDGREPTCMQRGLDLISLPAGICLRTRNVCELISFTFPDIARRYMDVNFLRGRAILTPLNSDVDEINSKVVEQFPGDVCTYYSADSVLECDESNVYPIEFLNSLQPSGCPPHKLALKVGMIVMLLRSIASHRGLCNGTRLIIRGLGRQIIEAEIVTGKDIGSRVLIPRIPLVPSNSDLPFELQRVQFPLRAAFAMTINKAQGQTMDAIGLYLPRPVFSHGQLYVALSRVRSAASVRVLISDNDNRFTDVEGVTRCTQNIVYSEVL